jgi:histidine decarboxylase
MNGEAGYQRYLSPFDRYCQGAVDSNAYLVALNVSSAVVHRRFSAESYGTLDETVAFDAAEIARMYLGQLNLVKVSSFCGPGGLIWGYDMVRSPNLKDKPLFSVTDGGREIPVYSAAPIMDSARALFGKVDSRRFPIMPGSICRAAWKSTVAKGPSTVYASLAFGIVSDRASSACLLMEDTGEIRGEPDDKWRRFVLEQSARSVLAVAANQRSSCREIFVAMATAEPGEGEVGCGLLVVPYFTLARDAVPAAGFEALKEMTTDEWGAAVGFDHD